MKLAHAPGLALLLLCARMRVDGPQSRRILSQIDRGVDWKALLSLAHRHGLIPILHRTLSDLPAGMVPAEILGQLQSMSEAFRLRNLIFLSELVRLQQAFAAADVVVMPYKGTALAGFLYRDAGLRQVLDVDLLVRPCDAIRARRVLLDQGCIPARTLSLRAEAAKVKYHFEFVFVSKGKLSVELQWRIAPGYWRLPKIEDFVQKVYASYMNYLVNQASTHGEKTDISTILLIETIYYYLKHKPELTQIYKKRRDNLAYILRGSVDIVRSSDLSLADLKSRIEGLQDRMRHLKGFSDDRKSKICQAFMFINQLETIALLLRRVKVFRREDVKLKNREMYRVIAQGIRCPGMKDLPLS